ncbi:hypothetical protein Glove_349g67 [Diversispora epigaea]|uniref:Uncharacterized protein n=1 Tax=Diversispora epigaea TaxID=1348612 RepID=A0A397HDS7_9GLOM|nr:hypothetical protein Glove_349g67 [Diversispora epigaea]
MEKKPPLNDLRVNSEAIRLKAKWSDKGTQNYSSGIGMLLIMDINVPKYINHSSNLSNLCIEFKDRKVISLSSYSSPLSLIKKKNSFKLFVMPYPY